MRDKISQEREKYELSLERHLLTKKQEEELRTEKAFKKYENFVRTKIII